MLGILVDGDNHFIVRGPLPDRDTARALIPGREFPSNPAIRGPVRMHRVPIQQAVEPIVPLHCPIRHGDVVFQVISSFVAQSVDLSVWQDVQGLGILYLSVIPGQMNLKVCELTNVPGTP